MAEVYGKTHSDGRRSVVRGVFISFDDPRIKREDLSLLKMRHPDDNPLEIVIEAWEQINKAKSQLAIYQAHFANEIANLGVPMFTTDVDTFAVQIAGDGLVKLFINPYFCIDHPPVTLGFGMVHETYHIVLAHVHEDIKNKDRITRLAAEVVINETVMRILEKPLRAASLKPKSDVPRYPDGRAVCIDPVAVYNQYETIARQSGQTPATYAEFVKSDLACAAFLRSIKNRVDEIFEENQQQSGGQGGGGGGQGQENGNGSSNTGKDRSGGGLNSGICNHGQQIGETVEGEGGESGEGDENGNGSHSHSGNLDKEQTGKIVDKIVSKVMTKALSGNEASKQAMIDLGQIVGERSKFFAKYGIGELTGDSADGITQNFWEKYLYDALTSILVPGDALKFPTPLLSARGLFAEAGADIPLYPFGDAMETEVAIFHDVSGSMGLEIPQIVGRLVGRIPGCRATFIAFNTVCQRYNPGEKYMIGGGTSFDIIEPFFQEIEEEEGINFDCILVLTDGYAPQISPQEPDKWIWLLPDNSDHWPANKNMQVVDFDVEEAVRAAK